MMNTVPTLLCLEVKTSLRAMAAQSAVSRETTAALWWISPSEPQGKGTAGAGEVRKLPDEDRGMKWLTRDGHGKDKGFQSCPCLDKIFCLGF